MEPPLCNVSLILTFLAFAPIFALQGRGYDVQSVHAGPCLRKLRQIQQDSFLRLCLGRQTLKIHAKTPRQNHKRVPSGTRKPGWNTKLGSSSPQRILKNREVETQYSRGKPSPRKENVNKHMGKHQIPKCISRALHVPHESASKRTMAPQTAPCCPEVPAKAEKSIKKD